MSKEESIVDESTDDVAVVEETDQPDEQEEQTDEPAAEEQESEVVVTIGDEPPPVQEEERAPDWVRDLRKQHRELQRRNRELEEKLKGTQPVATEPPLGAKPRLEDFDYDSERFETAMDAWYARKTKHDELKLQAKQAEEEQAKAWQSKLESYSKAKAELKVKDYEDAEAFAQETLSVTQQGVVLQGAENPALVVYALGKNPKKAKELAAINDPVKFAFAIAKLESQLKIQPRKTAPPPERTAPSGNAPISGATDGHLERLRSEAMRTGDMTKVIRYKQQQREKQSAKR